jgi:hypothetical protein
MKRQQKIVLITADEQVRALADKQFDDEVKKLVGRRGA